MSTTVIPLSRLQANPTALLTECCDSSQTFVIELPDHRLVTIQQLEGDETSDSLVDDLLARNSAFQALVAESKASPRMDFATELS